MVSSGGHLNLNLHMPHIHFHHHHGGGGRGIPKGCVAITVGQAGGAEHQQQRFVIPVAYVNHPLFRPLLKEAEEEYGFHQDGPINLPCEVGEFCHVRAMIDEEADKEHHHHHHHHAITTRFCVSRVY